MVSEGSAVRWPLLNLSKAKAYGLDLTRSMTGFVSKKLEMKTLSWIAEEIISGVSFS